MRVHGSKLRSASSTSSRSNVVVKGHTLELESRDIHAAVIQAHEPLKRTGLGFRFSPKP